MAAPIVSGIAALSLGILGAATGNFYQAGPLRNLLMATSDALTTPKSSSPTTTRSPAGVASGRVNSFSAVQQAWLLASLQSEDLPLLYPTHPIDSPLPMLNVQGFTATYITGAPLGPPLSQIPASSIFDVSTQPGGSYFSSFKYSSSFPKSSTSVIFTAYLQVWCMPSNL